MITEGGVAIADHQEIKTLDAGEGIKRFELGPGSYQFVVKPAP